MAVLPLAYKPVSVPEPVLERVSAVQVLVFALEARESAVQAVERVFEQAAEQVQAPERELPLLARGLEKAKVPIPFCSGHVFRLLLNSCLICILYFYQSAQLHLLQ